MKNAAITKFSKAIVKLNKYCRRLIFLNILKSMTNDICCALIYKELLEATKNKTVPQGSLRFIKNQNPSEKFNGQKKHLFHL